jgi:hypothetical protein
MYGDDNLEINDVNGKPKTTGGGGGGAVWGTITGTLSSQTDLQTALNGKFNNPTGSTSEYIDGTGGIQVFPTLTSADKMVTIGRNSTGATLYAGTIIYISGSTGNRPNYVRAQANSEATSAGTFGVIQADIPNNSDGNAVTIGTLSNLDTRSIAAHPFTVDTLVDGDTIYLSPTTAGYVTRVKPSAPSHLVYIGKVVRTSPTNGTIVYRIQNGYELDELHDVAINSIANNDLIQWDSATSLWKNKSLSGAGIQETLSSGTNIKTINSNSLLGSGNIAITASAVWGGITGTLSAQTDLQNALNAKQNNPILYCSSAVTVVTGTTNETLIASVPIPTTISNAMLRSSFTVRVTTLGAASPRSRIRIGTFASPTLAQITASTILATNAIGSLGMASIYRTMPVIGGASGSIKALATGSNANADYGQLAAFDVILRNFTTQQYLYFTIYNNTVAAQTECYGLLVENIQ